MKLDDFLKGYSEILLGESSLDSIFVALRISLHGMTSARTAKLLNNACRFLDDDEYYLEIGTYTGFSLLSAAYENGRNFVGIDNFTEKYSLGDGVKKELENNLERFPGANMVIDSDFQKVDIGNIIKPEKKIGVFFVDGKHVYEDVVDSVRWAWPYLSDQALIVFDDVNVPEVRKAIDELKIDPQFEEFFFAKSFYKDPADRGISSDHYIHNGISLMSYRKRGAVNV